ncbi:MAG: hypothetical protein ABIF12_00085 [bacterium]
MLLRKSIYIIFFLLFQSSLFSLSSSYRSIDSMRFGIGKICISLLKKEYIENFRFSNITKIDLDFILTWKEKESFDSNFSSRQVKFLLELLKGDSSRSIERLPVEDIKEIIREFKGLFDKLRTKTNFVSIPIIEIAIRFCSITNNLLEKDLVDSDIILSYKSILQQIYDSILDEIRFNWPLGFMQKLRTVPQILKEFFRMYNYFDCHELELDVLFSDCQKKEAYVSEIKCNIESYDFKNNFLDCSTLTLNLARLIVNKYEPANEFIRDVIARWSSGKEKRKPRFYKRKRISRFCNYDHCDTPDEIKTDYIEYAKTLSEILKNL